MTVKRISAQSRRRAVSFLRDIRGNVALVFGLAAPVLFATAGVAIDYSLAASQQSALQAAADSAAIAGARELALAGGYSDRIDQVARAVAIANVERREGRAEPVVTPSLTEDRSGVRVEITQETTSYFSDLVAVGPESIYVTATAKTLGEKVCVVGLEEKAANGIHLEENAQLTATGCSVYANSRNANAIWAEAQAQLRAQSICSAGGFKGGSNNFDPAPLTDCPPTPDPLSSRPPPEIGGCDHTRLEISTGTQTLYPGTYCKGLSVTGDAVVRLNPGVYVIQDGPFTADETAEIVGEHVGFYLTGPNATLRFSENSRIDLGAPRDGPMAGILFWEDRDDPGLRIFRITSNYANNLLGTIYLPNGRLVVDAEEAVADRSAYTALVVRRLELYEGPNLVLNADYDQTDVPVPEGVGPTGATRLVR